MKNRKAIYLIILAVIVLVVGLALYNHYKQDKVQPISYNEFISAVENGRVDSLVLDDSDILRGKYKDGRSFVTDNPRKDGFKEDLLVHDIRVSETSSQMQFDKLTGLLLTLALFAFVAISLKKKEKQAQGQLAKTALVSPEERVKTSFDSIAGNEEAKASIQEMVDFIKNPEKYTRYGARLPRGVILYGSPGTGKTLMAKAVAGEAGVPFFAVSGADFVQVYVGVGAGRIRDLFKKAREYGKCVIFIDEIDALGKKRDQGPNGSSNDERDQTLNALLAEMSGFNESEGIVVIAATNRLDTLDEALLRPGRFDRHIEIGLPDINSRRKILELHSRNKPLDESVDLDNLAYQTVYFSGAKLESLLNEAAIYAAKRDQGSIDKRDIDKAFYTIIAGAEKKDRSAIAERDRRVTAYHEAGHALVTSLIAPENKVTKVTIIPSTKGAGGFSMNIPPDRMYHRKIDMENAIKIALAGRAAEELVFGPDRVTTGASNDIERATGILVDMVRRFGMSEKSGLLNYDVLYQNGFNQPQSCTSEDLKKTMDDLYRKVTGIIEDNIHLLKAIAENLLLRETLEEKDLKLIMEAS